MGKDPDEAFLFREAVLDHVVADEERLDGGFKDIGHGEHSKESRRNGKTVLAFLQKWAEDTLSTGKSERRKNRFESRGVRNTNAVNPG